MRSQYQTRLGFDERYSILEKLKGKYNYIRKWARDSISAHPKLTIISSGIIGVGAAATGSLLVSMEATTDTIVAMNALETTSFGTFTALCLATPMSLSLTNTATVEGLVAGLTVGYLLYYSCKNAKNSEEFRSRLEDKDRTIENMRRFIEAKDRDTINRDIERIRQSLTILSLAQENSSREEERKRHLETIQRYKEDNLRQLAEIRNKDKALEALQAVTGIQFVNAEPISEIEGIPLEEETKEETSQQDNNENETWTSREESRLYRRR